MSHWYLSTLAPADRESARAHRQTRQVKNAMQESDLRLSPEFRPALVNLEKLACGRFSDITPLTAGKKRGFCRLRRLGSRFLRGGLTGETQLPRQREENLLLAADDFLGHFSTPAAKPLHDLLHQQFRS